jgi:hypothetical protein
MRGQPIGATGITQSYQRKLAKDRSMQMKNKLRD